MPSLLLIVHLIIRKTISAHLSIFWTFFVQDQIKHEGKNRLGHTL